MLNPLRASQRTGRQDLIRHCSEGQIEARELANLQGLRHAHKHSTAQRAEASVARELQTELESKNQQGWGRARLSRRSTETSPGQEGWELKTKQNSLMRLPKIWTNSKKKRCCKDCYIQPQPFWFGKSLTAKLFASWRIMENLPHMPSAFSPAFTSIHHWPLPQVGYWASATCGLAWYSHPCILWFALSCAVPVHAGFIFTHI